MPLSIVSLLAFVAWTMMLVAAMVSYRSAIVIVGRRRANAWPRGAPPEDERKLLLRMHDAHQNCVENLPLFGGIVLAASVTHALPAIDGASLWVVLARVGQSVAHLMGTSHWHVFVRALFFLAQLGLYAFMIFRLVG